MLAKLTTVLALCALLALAGCGSAGKKHAATSAPGTPPPSGAATTAQSQPTAADCPHPLSARAAATVVRRQEGPRANGLSYGRWMPDTGGTSSRRLKHAYDPSLELSAVVGETPRASTIGSPVQVFLFHKGCYLGTTTKAARFELRVEQAGSDTVAVHYNHFKQGDPLCCPTLPEYVVRYRWNGRKVMPLDPIPPPDQGTSRAPDVVKPARASPPGNAGPPVSTRTPGPASTCGGHPAPFPGRPDPCHRSSVNE